MVVMTCCERDADVYRRRGSVVVLCVVNERRSRERGGEEMPVARPWCVKKRTGGVGVDDEIARRGVEARTPDAMRGAVAMEARRVSMPALLLWCEVWIVGVVITMLVQPAVTTCHIPEGCEFVMIATIPLRRFLTADGSAAPPFIS
jgi:hypothetical protein